MDNIFDIDTTILTPNQRLAATLRKRYQSELSLQNSSWITPDILPLSSWLQRLWMDIENHAKTPFLLNSAQEQHVWGQIIQQSEKASLLLNKAETADLTQSAWLLLKQWQVQPHFSRVNLTEDYLALQEWLTLFQKTCSTRNWVDSATATDIIIQKINTKELSLPKKITVIGFTELPPQWNTLMTACHNQGCEIVFIENWKSFEKSFIAQTVFETEEDEITSIARWAKKIFLSTSKDTIACVFPNLDSKRDRIFQVFSEVFEGVSDALNVSAGKRLSDYPIIQAALKLLHLSNKTLNYETIYFLLTTPFLGHAESERIKRAYFDLELKNKNINRIDIEKNIDLFSSCPKLKKLIASFLCELQSIKEKSNYQEWASFFNHLLTVLGWPGERSLNSEEYQTIEVWKNALYELSTLDVIGKKVYFHEALSELKRILTNNIFQPKTPDSRVQILGLLEAAGSPFDHLWITGMDDVSWPPQPKPHPLLPKQLQRELNMPHATAERELTFCEAMTKQLKENASTVIFSYSKNHQDEARLSSPLIRDLPSFDLPSLQLEDYSSPSLRLFQSREVEMIVDNQAAPLNETHKVRGGVSILKKQSMCPFKAFAEHRLFANELEDQSFGLRKSTRGKLIHKILELTWNVLKTHQALLEISDHNLQKLIDINIDAAFIAIETSRFDYPHYLSLEKSRLKKVILQWMQIEKSRQPFTVMNNEDESTVTIGKLTFTIRIDRIDQLNNGKKLIIDYKTGKENHVKSWLGERPDEPQLPLYTLLDPENTSGIAYAQLYPGQYLYAGLSHYDMAIKGIKPINEWNAQITQWQSILTQLSNQFYDGIALVDPKEKPKTCEWCALKPLCRINDEVDHA